MSNKHKHTLQSILDKINRSDKALERALVVIRDNATPIQLARFDKYLLLHCVARITRCKIALSTSQLAYARQLLAQVKYYGILRRCADQIMQGEV